jgi:hypothetical protein
MWCREATGNAVYSSANYMEPLGWGLYCHVEKQHNKQHGLPRKDYFSCCVVANLILSFGNVLSVLRAFQGGRNLLGFSLPTFAFGC